MLKNNKGYFLTETIITLTIIATIITAVYVNSMSYYVKQNTELTKYNTIQGLYSIKEIKKYLNNEEESFKSSVNSNNLGYIDVINQNSLENDEFLKKLDVKNIYFINNSIENFIETSNIEPSIKKELKLINIDENVYEYKYLTIFKDGSYCILGVN